MNILPTAAQAILTCACWTFYSSFLLTTRKDVRKREPLFYYTGQRPCLKRRSHRHTPNHLHYCSYVERGKVLLAPSLMVIIPYLFLLWKSKHIKKEHVDQQYYNLKSPLAFIGDTIKKLIGL